MDRRPKQPELTATKVELLACRRDKPRRSSPRRIRSLVALLMAASCCAGLTLGPAASLSADELTSARVLDAIERGRRFLISEQRGDGGFATSLGNHEVGVTSLALLAMINSGLTVADPPVKRSLEYLRRVQAGEIEQTYDLALATMALVAARDGQRDLGRISALARRLEARQVSAGPNSGGWTYQAVNGMGGEDRSNSQFAILGLKEAADYGVNIREETWKRARQYWVSRQSGDGGWGYAGPAGGSSGSMTVAGIASMTIIGQQLRDDDGVAADGKPPCCDDPEPEVALERGLRWLEQHFRAGQNAAGGGWFLYYLYGVERAGRMTGQRFFGNHDWYREGAEVLLALADKSIDGRIIGLGHGESEPVVGTSLALLFLSKGLAPVLIHKLKYGPRDAAFGGEIRSRNWNRHPHDLRNLTEQITLLPRWPRLLTTQEVDLNRAAQTDGVVSLFQAPVLLISGSEAIRLPDEQKEILRQYIVQGGFVFATKNCGGDEFEASFKDLMRELLPGQGELRPLTADHPIYRSEYPLSAEGVPLLGIDFGCRTSVVYSPEDLGCYWEYWARNEPPRRVANLRSRIERTTRIGINVIAYATGREPPDKLASRQQAKQAAEVDRIEVGLLQVAKLKHTGSWDAAPRAVRNLLVALNETVGVVASTKVRNLPATDENLFRYPLAYMHGRLPFELNETERKQLRLYLDRGGVLIADSCCGAAAFDKSFRELVKQLYPETPLQRVPVTDDLFSDKIGREIRKLRRRSLEHAAANGTLQTTTMDVEPHIEAVEHEGRYVILYSKYDISCALEQQSSVNCEGYLPEDAARLATNLVLYATVQPAPIVGNAAVEKP